MMKTTKLMAMGLAIGLALALAVTTIGCKKKSEETSTAPAEVSSTGEKTETPAGEKTEAPAGTETQPAVGGTAAPTGEASAPARDLKTFKYVVEMKTPGQGAFRLEYLVDQKRFNMKMSTSEGGASKVNAHIISNGTDVFMLQPESKMAMKMPAENSKNMIPKDMIFMPDWGKFMADHAAEKMEKIGSGDVNGKPCSIYEYAIPGGNAKADYYVDSDNFLRRIETTDQNNQTTTIDVLELDANPAVSDADFQVPAGYQTMDMNQMMKGMPGMKGMPKPGEGENPPAQP